MSNLVTQWYEDKKNVDEMQQWNPALKEWERTVIRCFPAGARILRGRLLRSRAPE